MYKFYHFRQLRPLKTTKTLHEVHFSNSFPEFTAEDSILNKIPVVFKTKKSKK